MCGAKTKVHLKNSFVVTTVLYGRVSWKLGIQLEQGVVRRNRYESTVASWQKMGAYISCLKIQT